MLTTVEGIYENGQIILDEKPKLDKKSKVLITFLEIPSNSFTYKKEYVIGLDGIKILKKERKLGTMKGNFKMSDDFNTEIDFDDLV